LLLAHADIGGDVWGAVHGAGVVCILRGLETAGRLAVGDDDMLQLATGCYGGYPGRHRADQEKEKHVETQLELNERRWDPDNE